MSSKYLLENSSVDGYLLENGSGTLLLESFSLTDNISLFIHGFAAQNDNIDLFIHGPDTKVQGIDLFVGGFDTNNKNLDLTIVGHESITNNVDLFINGKDNKNQNLDLFIYGFDINNNNIDLTITGNESVNQNLNLFVGGKDALTANLDLIIIGEETNNGGLNLFIKGALGEDDDNFNLSLEQLFKNADYSPQIIGRFITDPSSVTIEVWNLMNNNSIVSLISNDCYEIGDTGRWAFSTINLPPLTRRVNQFVFKMTANTLETFEGEFILKTKKVGKDRKRRK